MPYAGTIAWNPQQDFRADLNSMLGAISDDGYLMFLVDDDVIFRPIDAALLLGAFGKEHLFISLRCSRTYEKDPLPELRRTDTFLEWQWNCHKGGTTCWNYPFSLDGNIFRAATIKRIVKRISFTAPNSLEGTMHTYRHKWWVKRIRLALAPLSACVLNNPLNKVQNESETRHAGISAKELNARYLQGEHIDNAIYSRHTPAAEHDVIELVFQPIL
jgi:hypothetical protein